MKNYARISVFTVALAAAAIAPAAGQSPSGEGHRTGNPPAHGDEVDDTNRLFAAATPRWIGTAKRIRAVFAGVAVADSTRAHLLRDGNVPVYYFPEADVRRDLLVSSSFVRNAPQRGDASFWSLKVGDRLAE